MASCNSPERERKTKATYELGTDVAFQFENGEIIPISRTVLAFHTRFLTDVFFGPSPAKKFKVDHFDSETFKTFLDCLLGLKEYTVLDSLLIYPIAHQYQVKESLEKCVAVLKPKVLDENIAHTLNLALFYFDDDLVSNVINFVKEKIGVVDFLENKEYRDSLEPKSICRLLEETHLHSFVWKFIYEWGENYLKKQCKPVTIPSFFNQIGISSLIELDHFESVQAIFDFHKMTNTELFDSNQILWHLESRMSKASVMRLPDKSEWVKQIDEKLTETIEFSHPLGFSFEDSKNGLSIQISTNKFIYKENEHNIDTPVLEVDARYSFRSISTSVAYCSTYSHFPHCKKFICECWIPLKLSPYDHKTGEMEEIDSDDQSCQYNFRIIVEPLAHRFQEIKSVEVTYNFKNISKCRILKTTLDGNFEKSDELYFTKSVVVSPN